MKKTKGISRRAASLTLALAMALGLTPVNALPVYAEEAASAVTSAAPEETPPEQAAPEIATTEQPGQEPAAPAAAPAPQAQPTATPAAEPAPAQTEPEAAAPEETTPATLEIEGETQTYLPDADALPDNDELFAGYAMRTLYGESGIATLGNYGPTVLKPTEQNIYSELKTAIQAIAAGTSSSTVHTTTTEFNLKWETDKSGEELKAEAAEKLKVFIDTDKIVDCLLADCPYELYWFDKTTGVKTDYSISTSTVTYNDGTSTTTANIENLTLSFSVASAYAGTDAYTTDTSKTSATSTAVTNAQAVIDANAGKTDYERLVAYKEYICNAVSYNDSAANPDNNTPYGDPWQLIYVFDGKEDTNVVCEGYSKAFQYLCDLSGLTCYTVTGIMTGGTGEGAHMWNIVTLDGANYLVDVTNSDTDAVGQDGGLFLAGTSGSVDAGYTFTIGNQSVTFTYDSDTKSLYGGNILTLAAENYTEPEPEPVYVAEVTINGTTTQYTDIQDAFTAANAGTADSPATVTLLADVTVSSTLSVENDDDITLTSDAPYSISGNIPYDSPTSIPAIIHVTGGVLTFQGGTINSTNAQGEGIRVTSGTLERSHKISTIASTGEPVFTIRRGNKGKRIL